uniref:Uncharacterized protein n=1 Tax=Cacopsylla melanoneura TaxID=428564 RepID=A0A8D8VUW5_9HEMI
MECNIFRTNTFLFVCNITQSPYFRISREHIWVNSTEKRTILAMKFVESLTFFREFSHILTVTFASIILKYEEVKYTCSSCSILEHSNLNVSKKAKDYEKY